MVVSREKKTEKMMSELPAILKLLIGLLHAKRWKIPVGDAFKIVFCHSKQFSVSRRAEA